MANQNGKQEMGKFTYSLDLNDQVALGLSKYFESIIKKSIEPFQQEGQKIMKSSRSYDDGGKRHVDYYMDKQYAEAARNAVDRYIKDQEAARKREIQASVSGVSSSVFRTNRQQIFDPAKRAEIARKVIESGGFFDTDSRGISHWGVDANLTATSTRGRQAALASVLNGSAIASNTAYQRRWEGLMSQTTGSKRGFWEFTPSQRKELERVASGIGIEKERTTMRMVRARKRYEAQIAYDKANPDDPLVRARQKRSDIAHNKKIEGITRMARGAVLVTITAILGAVIGVVSTLEKIGEKITELGQSIRKQGMADTRYNLPGGTTRAWEVYAGKMGYDPTLLEGAASSVSSHFGNVLNYNKSDFSKFAPYLKSGTVELLRTSASSGDPNVMGIISSVIDELFAASEKGIAGTKTGISKDQAFSENIKLLSDFDPSWGSLAELRYREYKKSGAKSVADWKGTDFLGKERSYDTMNWLTQGMWGARNSESRNAISGTSAQAGTEETMLSVTNFDGTMSELIRQIFEAFASNGHIAQTIEDIRSGVMQIVGKFYPQVAEKERFSNIDKNRESTGKLKAQVDWQKQAADTAARELGYKDADDAINTWSSTKMKNTSTDQLMKLRDEGNMYAVSAYAMTALKLEELAEQENNAARPGETVNVVAGTSAEHRARAAADFALSFQEKINKEIAKRLSSASTVSGTMAGIPENVIDKLGIPDAAKTQRAMSGLSDLMPALEQLNSKAGFSVGEFFKQHPTGRLNIDVNDEMVKAGATSVPTTFNFTFVDKNGTLRSGGSFTVNTPLGSDINNVTANVDLHSMYAESLSTQRKVR